MHISLWVKRKKEKIKQTSWESQSTNTSLVSVGSMGNLERVGIGEEGIENQQIASGSVGEKGSTNIVCKLSVSRK